MLNLKTLFLALLIMPLLCASTKASAQNDFRPGYYITWENDTIQGLIDYRCEIRNSKLCAFKKNQDSETIRFSPEEIKGYRFIDSKYYISREIETEDAKKQVFLEFLLNGITNLYFYRTKDYSFYLLEDRDERLWKLENKSEEIYHEVKGSVSIKSYKHIGYLKLTFADCMEIHSKIDNINLTHKSLINITKEYHDHVCDDEECVIFEKKLPAFRFYIAPEAGLSISSLSFSAGSYEDFYFSPVASPILGVNIETSMPRISEKITIQAVFLYGESDYFSHHEEQTPLRTLHYNINVNTKFLNNSLAFKYLYPRGKIRPSLTIGIAYENLIQKNISEELKAFSNDKVYTHNPNLMRMGDNMAGPFVQVGGNFRIFDKQAYGQIHYSHLRGDRTDKTRINRLNTTFGLYLNRK